VPANPRRIGSLNAVTLRMHPHVSGGLGASVGSAFNCSRKKEGCTVAPMFSRANAQLLQQLASQNAVKAPAAYYCAH
jgi:hypothetical protein